MIDYKLIQKMKLPKRKDMLDIFKYIFVIVIVLEIISAVLFYSGYYPFDITAGYFWFSMFKTLIAWTLLFLIVWYVYPDR